MSRSELGVDSFEIWTSTGNNCRFLPKKRIKKLKIFSKPTKPRRERKITKGLFVWWKLLAKMDKWRKSCLGEISAVKSLVHGVDSSGHINQQDTDSTVNPFHATGLFRYSLILWLMLFRGYWKRPVTWNELMRQSAAQQ